MSDTIETIKAALQITRELKISEVVFGSIGIVVGTVYGMLFARVNKKITERVHDVLKALWQKYFGKKQQEEEKK